jgi:uncharacterized protein (DUF1499 family)
MCTFWRWLTRNWADTDEPGDPALAPRRLGLPPREALEAVRAAVERLPRWRVESIDPDLLTLRATRRTRLFRYVDDVTVHLESDGGGSRLHAKSRSRVGKGDLGQNRRNLLELFAALDRDGPPGGGKDG